MLRQSQGRQYRGHALTAGALQNQSVQLLLQMIQRDDAYKFLKNVRGSPAYFQKVMDDVLAMIRLLGLPTWFFTLSAADMPLAGSMDAPSLMRKLLQCCLRRRASG